MVHVFRAGFINCIDDMSRHVFPLFIASITGGPDHNRTDLRDGVAVVRDTTVLAEVDPRCVEVGERPVTDETDVRLDAGVVVPVPAQFGVVDEPRVTLGADVRPDVEMHVHVTAETLRDREQPTAFGALERHLFTVLAHVRRVLL